MRITSEHHLPAPAAQIAQMFADATFIEFRGNATEARIDDTVVTGSPEAEFTVTTRRSVPAEQIPAQMRPFVGARLEIRQVEAWEPETDGVRIGSVVLEITGTPVRMTGTMRLAPHPESGTLLVYEGDLKAAVPLFASTIEQAAAQAVHSTLDQEAAAARQWLAAQSE